MSKNDQTGYPPEDLTLESLEKRIKALEDYVNLVVGTWVKGSLKLKKELVDFSDWSSLDVLLYIWRYYDMEKRQDFYFSDKFQALMSNLEEYLKNFSTTRGKWEFIRQKPEDKAVKHYWRVYEDEVIRLNLGEETLQIVTIHDSAAYDIPLKLLKEALKYELVNK